MRRKLPTPLAGRQFKLRIGGGVGLLRASPSGAVHRGSAVRGIGPREYRGWLTCLRGRALAEARVAGKAHRVLFDRQIETESRWNGADASFRLRGDAQRPTMEPSWPASKSKGPFGVRRTNAPSTGKRLLVLNQSASLRRTRTGPFHPSNARASIGGAMSIGTLFNGPRCLMFVAVFASAITFSEARGACPAPQPPPSFCGDPACTQVICFSSDNTWGCTTSNLMAACGTGGHCDSAGNCNYNAWSCPDTPTATGPNRQIATPGGHAGRCYFCGQNNKYHKDGVTIKRNDGHTIPSDGEDPVWVRWSGSGNGYVECHNRTQGSLYGDAKEVAEIRGWVVGVDSPHVDATDKSEDER